MSVIEFNLTPQRDIIFCCVDNTDTFESHNIKAITKNIGFFTISNLIGKLQAVLQGKKSEELLSHAINLNYNYAVVYNIGTEFINGYDFIHYAYKLIENDFLVAGHILDRSEGYYELHHQCYIVNLKKYNALGKPLLGETVFNSHHVQIEPERSTDNIHDQYTPKWIKTGTSSKEYKHKCHGYNLISEGLKHKESILVFDETIRYNKKHYYPESKKDFHKCLQHAYFKYNYCLQNFVHTQNSEYLKINENNFTQILTPASGSKVLDYISKNKQVTIIYYDYNEQSLEYWKKNSIPLDNVTYKFVHLDLLGDEVNIEQILDSTQKTLINLSNIFCYEGTTTFTDFEYRIFKENQIIANIQKHSPEAYLYFSTRAATGFAELIMQGFAKEFNLTTVDDLRLPTWSL